MALTRIIVFLISLAPINSSVLSSTQESGLERVFFGSQLRNLSRLLSKYACPMVDGIVSGRFELHLNFWCSGSKASLGAGTEIELPNPPKN